MLKIEQMKGGYYVLRLETETIKLVQVFQGTENIQVDELEKEPGGLLIELKTE